MFTKVSVKKCTMILLSSIFVAFGFYNVHSISGVTEGGIYGLTLLLDHVFDISPAISGFLMNVSCYFLGWKLLGWEFIIYSVVSNVGFSAAYGFFEQFEPLWPQLYDMPLTASVIGALFIGIGAGIVVRCGGAGSGDDALAMSISYITKIKIQWIYLVSDLLVLGLSLLYIPWQRIGYSLLTVILSGQIIGVVQDIKLGKKNMGSIS